MEQEKDMAPASEDAKFEGATFAMVAKTMKGLEAVLADELRALGAADVEPGHRMVSFRGDKAMLYKADLCCRTALRILKPFYTFRADDADTLYDRVKMFDWGQLLSVDSTFAIDAVVYSETFTHSRFVTYRVKDAIADWFRDHFDGKRPGVRLDGADVLINVHISGDEVTLSLDSSGESLHRRGYRAAQTEAPINEVLAAGIILMSGYRGESVFLDPMCGSGTFVIEAAMIAANINPGVYRKGFAFEHWPDFDQELFDSIYNDDSAEREFEYKIYGSDNSPKAIAIAERNIKSASVGKDIELKTMPIQEYTEAPENGILITNPPYGERISADDMDALYASIGERLKNVFRGYHAWIIGYKPEYFDKIGLKPSVKFPVLNGALECEFREYVIFDGTYAEFRKQGRSIRNEEFKRPERPVRRRRDNDERDERQARRWKNQGGKFRGDRDFKRDDDQWERDRRGVRRRRAQNALEEHYHKPYNERFRDSKRSKDSARFEDDKVRRAVKFKKPRLFDDSDFESGDVVMRHRNRKDNQD